jgi:hypothetical protein
VGQFLACHLELAKEALNNSEYTKAFTLLERAQTYPDNLGEGKLLSAQENDIFYLKGLVYEKTGN